MGTPKHDAARSTSVASLPRSALPRGVSLRRVLPSALLAVIATPVLLVLVMAWLQRPATQTQRQALRALVENLRGGDLSPEERTAFAMEHGVRLTYYDAQGGVVWQVDRAPRDRNALGFVSAGAAPQREVGSGSLTPRTLAEVLRGGAAEQCVLAGQGELLRCSVWRRLGDGAGAVPMARVVGLERDATRGVVRLLQDADGRPLWLLLGIGVFTGLLLAAVLLRGLVRPLNLLRAAVVERSRDGIDTQPIPVGGPAELGDVTVAFNRLLEALDEERERSERLVEDLTHELKTPLASLRGSLELLEGSLEGEGREHSKRARAAVAQLERSTFSLLELSRAEARRFGEEPQRFALAPMVEALVDAFEEELLGDPSRGEESDAGEGTPEAQRRRPSIAISVSTAMNDSEPGMVRAAPEALGRAIRALLENAVAFADARVLVEVGNDGAQVWVRVVDDGPGVPPALRARLFERFVSHRPGGTGIGLSLVRAVAEAHGGQVMLEQGPDAVGEADAGGASFCLFLPIA